MTKEWLPIGTHVVAEFADCRKILGTIVRQDAGRDGDLEQYEIEYNTVQPVARKTWCDRRHLTLSEPDRVLPDAYTAALARAEQAERERDDALAKLASAPDRITTTGHNDFTSYPWWAVVDPRPGIVRRDEAVSQYALAITGPFFSRASANEYLAAHRYRHGTLAAVWCFSGHASHDYRSRHRHVDALKGTP